MERLGRISRIAGLLSVLTGVMNCDDFGIFSRRGDPDAQDAGIVHDFRNVYAEDLLATVDMPSDLAPPLLPDLVKLDITSPPDLCVDNDNDGVCACTQAELMQWQQGNAVQCDCGDGDPKVSPKLPELCDASANACGDPSVDMNCRKAWLIGAKDNNCNGRDDLVDFAQQGLGQNGCWGGDPNGYFKVCVPQQIGPPQIKCCDLNQASQSNFVCK